MTNSQRLTAYALIVISALIVGLILGTSIATKAKKPWPQQTLAADQVLICFDKAGHPTTGSDWAECKLVKL